MIKHSILALIGILLVSCSGLQVNLPVTFDEPRREDVALLVMVENRANNPIRITYPITTDMLYKGQYTIFPVPRPGNYKVVITASSIDRRWGNIFSPIATKEIPVFMNGYDYIRINGRYIGYHLVITDRMILQNR